MIRRNWFIALAAFALCAVFCVAGNAQTWDETAQGGGDAGDLPGSAQLVGGTGSLTAITGDITSATDRDIYRIRIATAATFSANTFTTPGANTDTQIRLFQLSGLGIAFNDDRAADFLSDMPAGNALYNTLPAGEYLIAISGYNQRSNSAGGDQFPNAFGGTVAGPTGAGGGGVLTNWTGTNTTGTYRLTLTGCEYAAPPGDPEINLQRAATSIISGGPDLLGQRPVGAQFVLTYTIQNLGAANPLTVSGITVTGTPSNCSVTLTALTPASPIAAAGSATFDAQVTVAAFGAFSFVMSIANNDVTGGENPYVINASGFGAMSGNYNITSAGGGAFTDIGAAFDALETNGVGGAVTLTVTDSANYTATASYSLGLNAAFTAVAPVAGASAVNTITLRAAAGQRPTITGGPTGAGLNGNTGRGALAIQQSFVTIQGIDVTGTGVTHFGIIIQANPTVTASNVVITRCSAYGIANGPGICIHGINSYSTNITITNNIIYSCLTTAVPGTALSSNCTASLMVRNPSTAVVIEHNSILHNSTIATTSAFRIHDGGGAGVATSVFRHNVFQVTSATLNCIQVATVALNPAAATCNYNMYRCTLFHTDTVNFPGGIAGWQGGTSLRDTWASTAVVGSDPLFVSTTVPVNLHLQSGSPAIDVGTTSAFTIDLDGDTRPQGTAADLGADEFAPPEIDIQRPAATSIVDGEPNHALGSVSTLTGQSFTFTVANSGTGVLNLPGATPVTISGITGGATVNVTTQPAGSVAPSGSTTFVVFVQPVAAGAFTFQVNVANNDSNENPYDFVCQGTGFTNAPPVLALATSTDFVAGSDFDLTVAPGASLAGTNGAVLTVTDATPDPVDATITFTTGPQGVTPPTGITAPANVTGGAGAGFNLTWTGTANATNTPGTYVWNVQLADGVSTVNYAVRIIITNAAPAHVVIAPTTGDGALATPYTRTIDIGSTTAVNIATVSDANTGQNLNFVSQTLTASPGGSSATHTFSLSPVAGNPATLVCTPSAAVLADLGNFDYTIVVEDDTTPTPVQTTLYVRITIVGTAPTITSTALTTAAVGFPYSYQLTATGNPSTFTFGATPLPAWLSINGTGLISGTPAVGDIGVTPSITATAANGVAPAAQQIFTITVSAAVAPAITSTAVTTATVSTLYTYTFTLTGNPTPTLSLTTGTLPAWLTLVGNTLSGTPPTGSAGTYGPFTFTAANGVAPDATQTFSITVSNAGGGGGGGGGGGDDGGCSTGESNSLWMLAGVLASFALALRLRRKAA